jgi:hypothetical protein
MKENAKDLQFSSQCAYALLESFNSNNKSFDPYHISIILKSLITLREQFAVRAVKNNATNLLAKQEKTFQKNKVNLYKNLDKILETEIPQPFMACIENVFLNEKLDTLSSLEKDFYVLSHQTNATQIIDEIITPETLGSIGVKNTEMRTSLIEKVKAFQENSECKEILIKKKTTNTDLLGGAVVKLNTQLVDCSTNNLIRIQLRKGA